MLYICIHIQKLQHFIFVLFFSYNTTSSLHPFFISLAISCLTSFSSTSCQIKKKSIEYTSIYNPCMKLTACQTKTNKQTDRQWQTVFLIAYSVYEYVTLGGIRVLYAVWFDGITDLISFCSLSRRIDLGGCEKAKKNVENVYLLYVNIASHLQ